MTDEEGDIVWSARYEAFGKASVAMSGNYKNPLRFQGQYEDEETGLHYNYHRYYDPRLGRYLSKDPIGLRGGVNLRGYVGGNTVNRADPLGLLFFIPALAGAGGAATAGTITAGAASAGAVVTEVATYVAVALGMVAVSTISGDTSVSSSSNSKSKNCGKKSKKCRCTIRYAPADIMRDCPPRVYGCGEDMHDCQNDAKFSVEQKCRQYYGHCGWT